MSFDALPFRHRLSKALGVRCRDINTLSLLESFGGAGSTFARAAY